MKGHKRGHGSRNARQGRLHSRQLQSVEATIVQRPELIALRREIAAPRNARPNRGPSEGPCHMYMYTHTYVYIQQEDLRPERSRLECDFM